MSPSSKANSIQSFLSLSLSASPPHRLTKRSKNAESKKDRRFHNSTKLGFYKTAIPVQASLYISQALKFITVDMDKLKLASSSLGERLKTGGAQMSRMVSSKMKEILQSPTPESKMVDEATSEHMEEPNWGLNLRICAMINSEEFSGSEIVKNIKKKLSGKSVACQRLSLDLLEACTSNCEKVFSEVASEKVLEDMVRMIDDPKTDLANRGKALQLIRAWGESEDLKYLPVFHQTYMNLKTREIPSAPVDGNSSPMQYSLGSFIHGEPISPPERYPIPDSSLNEGDNAAFPTIYGSQSIEQKKETMEITRNSIDILSSILNSETEPKPIKDDLTVSMLEKCRQSLPAIQMIVESTTDDEVMLFEALNLHDQLQQIISKYEKMKVALSSGMVVPPEKSDSPEANLLLMQAGGPRIETEMADSQKQESPESNKETEKPDTSKKESTESNVDMRRSE
ncbi:unnamed protein product [Camellia sinensis]